MAIDLVTGRSGPAFAETESEVAARVRPARGAIRRRGIEPAGPRRTQTVLDDQELTVNTAARTLTAVFAAAVLAIAAVPAEAQGRHGGFGGHRGGHGGHGWAWGGPVIGLGIGIGLGSYYGGYGGYWGPVYPDYPGVIVVEGGAAPGTVVATPPAQPDARRGPPEPVVYPRTGQSPAQTEADRQDCNRWATTQQAAMSDASVFQRAVAACLDGRGYTVR